MSWTFHRIEGVLHPHLKPMAHLIRVEVRQIRSAKIAPDTALIDDHAVGR